MANNETLNETGLRLLELARTKSNREERDELLDMSDAFLRAAQTGSALARTALNCRDVKYLEDQMRRHKRNMAHIPLRDDVPPADEFSAA